MIFPGSRLWHEGVASDLSLLTDEIRNSSFSGHIVLEFLDSLDLVIVSRGEFLKVIEKIGRRIMTTKKYREIWGKCQIKQGNMYVFELPPPLAEILRCLSHRRAVLRDSTEISELSRVISEQREAKLNGCLEAVSGDGKGIMEFRDGQITSCFYSGYQGLSYCGFDAFVRWHGTLQRPGTSFSLFLYDTVPGSDSSHEWEKILTEGMDEVRLPLRHSTERLFAAFGKAAFEGESLFREGEALDQAYYLLEGHIELSRLTGGRSQVVGRLGKGSLLGLSWLNGRRSPSMSGTAANNCRLLAFDRTQMRQIFYNAPELGTSLIGKAAGQLWGINRRREIFAVQPRLRDLEYHVFEALNQNPERLRRGISPGELFRELAQTAPFSLPEMDQMVRELVGAGRIELSSDVVALKPEEI